MRDVAAHDLNFIAQTGLLGLSMGPPERRVLPPALIADIAGGTYPAIVNILLALRQRDATGKGSHLDLSMAENLFPFLYWAMGNGLAAGQWPVNGGELVTGGTARFQIYTTRDGKAVAAAPLEQKFWDNFCDLIGLESSWRDDEVDPPGTIARVAAIIGGESSEHWHAKFAGKDCCCSIVRNVEEALKDPHFRARGVFRHALKNEKGAVMPALPMAVVPQFRGNPDIALEAPALGAHNEEYLR
jgi:crotonobetainyl-CoA:carnitine CoA-transferase CaiB-like acyl-CoA transferase